MSREGGARNDQIIQSVMQDNREIILRLRKNTDTAGFDLYVATDRDALTAALGNGAPMDSKNVAVFKDIKYSDIPDVQNTKEFKLLNADLLRLFPDAGESSLYYAVRDVRVNYRESMATSVQKLPLISVKADISSILLTLAFLSLIAALLLSLQRISCTLALDGKQKFLLSGGKQAILKCTREGAAPDLVAFNAYPSSFDIQNITMP